MRFRKLPRTGCICSGNVGRRLRARHDLSHYPAFVGSIKDVHGAEIHALDNAIDFTGLRVLEVGAGEGRMTTRYAGLTESVLAIEPDAESLATARAHVPPELQERISFRLVDAAELDEPAESFDAAFLSWSL
jgi:ubiquinone/menaquinone biosynthesis C-methylase UbiE